MPKTKQAVTCNWCGVDEKQCYYYEYGLCYRCDTAMEEAMKYLSWSLALVAIVDASIKRYKHCPEFVRWPFGYDWEHLCEEDSDAKE
jgi:hypothetical protein